MKHLYLFTICLLLRVPLANGQTSQISFPTSETVKKLMDEAVAKSDLPAVVAVAINTNNQKVTYSYGNAVWKEPTKVTERHIFRIWSMTKLVTSIAAMQMVEQGLVALDDDLSNLLPDMAEIPILSDSRLVPARNPITLRHLLTHTSGFGYGGTDLELSKFKDPKWPYKGLPRRFESGSRFLYGSSTYWAGKLVEKLSNMDLETYFRRNITGPLGMNRTWFNLPDSLKKYIVSRGRRGDDGMQPLTEQSERIPTNLVTEFRGDGGLFSSPEDYTVLLNCLLHYGTLGKTKLLKKETVLNMTRNQIGTLSMNVAGAYYDPGFCCNMNGLISPSSKWGLAWLIDMEDKPYGPKAGTVSWGGAANTYFYIDYKSGIAASIYTQHVPFNHPATIGLFQMFSKIIYGLR